LNLIGLDHSSELLGTNDLDLSVVSQPVGRGSLMGYGAAF